MLGAIKRRWKSKKAKVLHKGTTSDLSTSPDNCPVTRGAFTETGGDGSNEKNGTKPPSPRQIHPISEKTEVKCTLTNLNQGSPQRNTTLPGKTPAEGRSLSSSPRHRGIQKKDIGSPAAFIHVNSGRIELVSKESGSSGPGMTGVGVGLWKGAGASVSPRGSDAATTTDKLRRLSGRLRNDTRHSWCAGGDGPSPATAAGFRHPDHGSPQHQNNNLGFRPKIKGGDAAVSLQSRLLGPIQLQGPGLSPEKRKIEQERQQQRQVDVEEEDEEENTYSVPTDESNPEEVARTLRLRTVLLEDRLRLMEGLTGNLANCRIMDKNEYEKCMTELTSQVSRAVSLQQLMKSEVEKLSSRIVELETHNNTIASMIIPTLMRLEETIANSSPKPTRALPRGESASCDRSPARRTQQNRDYVANFNKRSNVDVIRLSNGNCSKKSPAKNANNCTGQKLRQQNGELSLSTAVTSNPAIAIPTAGKEDYEVVSSANANPFCNASTRTNPLLSTRFSTRVGASANGGASSGRLSPLSKSESSSITRSANQIHAHAKKNGGSNSKLAVAGAKKSFTYSGIPRIASGSGPSPSPFSNNASSSAKSNSNASCNSSPIKTSITNAKSSLFSNQSSKNNESGGISISRRSVNSSPARDLHNYSNGSGGASSSAGASVNANGSRLPVLRKNTTNLKKLINSFDAKKNRLTPASSAAAPGTALNGSCNLLMTTTTSKSKDGSSSLQRQQDNSVEEGQIGVPGLGAHKDEGYSTMSSEALAEQENNNTLLITEKSDGSSDSTKNNTKNESTVSGISGKKSFGVNMRKSNTVNTFLPGSVGSSPTNCPSEQRKLMMMRDAERRLNNLIGIGSRNVRNCDNDDGQGNVMTVMTSAATASASLPSTSRHQTRTKRSNGYGYGLGYDADDDEHVHAHAHANANYANDDEEDPSTILWEDSDDSDILFLPLEVSSEDQSTLVPLSDQSTSCNNYANNSSTTTNNSTLSGREQYPLRRTKGEEFVALLSSKLAHHQRSLNSSVYAEEHEHADEEVEERALIEKWMKLEDVRNQVQWEEEWAWDWDGVERTKRHPLARYQSNRASNHSRPPQPQPQEIDHKITLSGPEHQSEEVQNSETWKTATATKNSLSSRGGSGTLDAGSSRTFTKDVVTAVAAEKSRIDSNTWTKSSSSGSSRNMTIKNDADANFINESKEKLSTCSSSNQTDRSLRGGERDEEKLSKVSNEWESMKPDGGEESTCRSRSLIKKEQHQVEEGIPGSEMIDNSLGAERTSQNSPSPPPAIEFTPEYYHLVNLNSSKNFETCNYFSRRHASQEAEESSQTMDDKVSQTDFACSLDSLSVSSELFTECRNCLELIKRLVGGASGDEAEDEERKAGSSSSFLHSHQGTRETGADMGSPTTWVSVPKGVSNTEVNRILEILSSSESEDILSPSK